MISNELTEPRAPLRCPNCDDGLLSPCSKDPYCVHCDKCLFCDQIPAGTFATYFSEPMFFCPDCGDLRVQCTAWVRANTDEILESGSDGPRDAYYCEHCEERLNHGHKNHMRLGPRQEALALRLSFNKDNPHR